MNRSTAACTSLLVAAWLVPAPASAAPELLVLELRAELGVEAELARLLTEMVVARLHEVGEHQIVAAADLARLLDLETQKQLLGCGDDTCLAEIAGALDADLLVSGSVARLGEAPVLTLKLLEVKGSRLQNQLNETLPAEPEAMAEAMRVATYTLLGREAPPLPVPWYRNGWVWSAVGVGAVAVGLGAYLLLRPPTAPESNLGQVTLHGN